MPDEKLDPKPEAKPEPKPERRAPALELPSVGAVVRYFPKNDGPVMSAIVVTVTSAGLADLKLIPKNRPRLAHLAPGVVRHNSVAFSKEPKPGCWTP